MAQPLGETANILGLLILPEQDFIFHVPVIVYNSNLLWKNGVRVDGQLLIYLHMDIDKEKCFWKKKKKLPLTPMLSTWWNNFSIKLQKFVHRDWIQTRIAALFTMVTLHIVFTLFCSPCASLHSSIWPTHPPGFVLFLSFLLSFSITLPQQPITMFQHKIQFWLLATRCLIVLFSHFNLSLPCAFLPPTYLYHPLNINTLNCPTPPLALPPMLLRFYCCHTPQGHLLHCSRFPPLPQSSSLPVVC